MLKKPPFLSNYDHNSNTTVITDASPTGLGAILTTGKDERPVIFVSRSLSDSEKNYSQLEREGLGVIFAFTRLRQYLLGRKFKLVVDNKPLSSIISKKLPSMASSGLQRWTLKMLEYDFHIEVRKSHQIPVVDWLSRMKQDLPRNNDSEEDFKLYFLETMDKLSKIITSKTVARETSNDPILSKVSRYVKDGWLPEVSEAFKSYHTNYPKHTLESGCLMWGGRVVIPLKLRETIMNNLHTSHPGVVRMKRLARRYVWWPKIHQEIENMISSCN